jgi:predicted nucleotide-binding protein
MSKHHGTIDELKLAVEACGYTGEWSVRQEGSQYLFRAKSGEVLNWWPSKGTLQFQGKNIADFQSSIMQRLANGKPILRETAPENAKIFVVHEHDREARDQLELILMRLGLQPFILQNQDGGSKTIIEALEQNIYKESNFGIILLTPDDFGYSKSKTETERQPRARQNVILEMGMIMAALGRQRMMILKKGALELPSDAAGILYTEFNDHVREIVPKLAQRLQGAGFNISAQRIADASS